MTDESNEKPFLSRWSERKRAVRAEEEGQGAAPATQDAPSAASAEALEANRKAAEAIDLETLTDRSDYAPFFRAGVPPALKSAALKKLWRSNPVFAVLDGLNDYDEDFTWPSPGSEVVRSAWKVGKGFLAGEDEATTVERAAAKPPADRATAPREAAVPAGAEEEASARAEEEPLPDDPGPELQEAWPPKVSLAKRLDLAAFEKEKGEG